MLINVVNFLLFAHISFVSLCLRCCISLLLFLPLLFGPFSFSGLFVEKFMTLLFSVAVVVVVAVVPPADFLLLSFDALLASRGVGPLCYPLPSSPYSNSNPWT